MKRALTTVLSVAALLLLSASPSWAYEPVTIVHTERVEAGPYGITVGFGRWPIRAMQSLDFTFTPDGGREGKSGVVEASLPDGVAGEQWPLARHPRKPEVWGLDIQALGGDGQWTFRFTVDGPDGRGVGELAGVTVLAQPGPPLALSWSVAGIPLLALFGFLVVAWRRVRVPREQLTAV
ncbi:hypothetical protein ACFFQW_41335 [Umezawaea endophytica]|uniref:Uncharacterized protein n=1 Tax=Umezawaea endophytica TaxID=1654476 RepID=A0A9X3AG18_9PSEU|nr:hypothetical protein [Umezawaea endophytica]MCS7477915.1 hypothetical protein [Umezawaea endophytica]